MFLLDDLQMTTFFVLQYNLQRLLQVKNISFSSESVWNLNLRKNFSSNLTEVLTYFQFYIF
jgi:hypothetical protein